jgi:hypothetical protein
MSARLALENRNRSFIRLRRLVDILPRASRPAGRINRKKATSWLPGMRAGEQLQQDWRRRFWRLKLVLATTAIAGERPMQVKLMHLEYWRDDNDRGSSVRRQEVSTPGVARSIIPSRRASAIRGKVAHVLIYFRPTHRMSSIVV